MAKMDRAARNEFGATIAQMERAEQLWQEAYRAAEKAANQPGRAAKSNDKMDYSLKRLSEDETGAIIQYKGPEAYTLNARLRAGAELNDLQSDRVKNMDSGLKKLPKVPGVSYRTLSFDDAFDAEGEYNDFLAAHQAGKPVFYEAYTSASKRIDGHPMADGTEYGITLEITGANARDLAGFGNNFEQEVLFERNKRFIVTGVSTDSAGYPYIYMEEVTENGAFGHSEERGTAVRDVQEPHSVHVHLQSISERDSYGNRKRELGPQGTLSRGQGDFVRTRGPEQTGSGAAPQEQNRLKPGTTPQQAELSDANTQYSLRTKEPPKKVGTAYKVFFVKNGQLYPPMVANPGGEGTPVGVWLDADVGVSAGVSKTGRPQVKAGGKGTQGGGGKLAFRPGWHLGDLPLATQFNRVNPETGKKELFPADFVWAECEYAMDHDYQAESRRNHKQELHAEIAQFTMRHTMDECEALLSSNNVASGRINTLAMACSDPQIAARNMIVEVDHPVAGKYKMAGNPLNFSGYPNSTYEPAPLLGQHTHEVLSKYLGMSDAEIDEILEGQKDLLDS